MSAGVNVMTESDNFVSVEYGGAHIEFSKDGDSPNCPNSWTWWLWYDGQTVDNDIDERSFAKSRNEAVRSIEAIIDDLKQVKDFLASVNVLNRGGWAYDRY